MLMMAVVKWLKHVFVCVLLLLLLILLMSGAEHEVRK